MSDTYGARRKLELRSLRTAQLPKRFLWALALIAGSAVSAFGQTAAAAISGRVTDPQGAVLIGATVELISVERGTTTSTTTNPAGIYSFLSVQPGEYRLVARSKGFKQGEVQKLTVDVGSSIEQNVQLELGELSQTVNVESTETLVNTVSPTVSSVVTGAPIQDLPLNGRDTLQLALTQPGIMSSAINTTPGPLHGVPYDFVVAGGTPSSVTYLLNGGNNTSVAYATPIVNPNPDTVAEFRILTNDYSAEYGRSAGGVVMVITKSGTNKLHGTAYDYLRNTDLNANNFFNQQAEQTLDRAIDITEQAIAEGRDTIQDLRTGQPPESDLLKLLTQAGKELASSQDCQPKPPAFRVAVEGVRGYVSKALSGNRNLNPLIQDEAYRIGRELLRNAYKHANATEIEAEIRYEERTFRLRIRDDGKGIDPKILNAGGRAGHWGLIGMRERAKAIGGQLEIWSNPGAGTEVELMIPAEFAYAQTNNGRRFWRHRRRDKAAS